MPNQRTASDKDRILQGTKPAALPAVLVPRSGSQARLKAASGARGAGKGKTYGL